MTYMYSIMFILLSGSQSNALVFGTSKYASRNKIDFRLQKFLAIVLVGAICQLQSLSRLNYIRFSNVLAIYKVTLLGVITILVDVLWDSTEHQPLLLRVLHMGRSTSMKALRILIQRHTALPSLFWTSCVSTVVMKMQIS
jgi:hypothetical protein